MNKTFIWQRFVKCCSCVGLFGAKKKSKTKQKSRKHFPPGVGPHCATWADKQIQAEVFLFLSFRLSIEKSGNRNWKIPYLKSFSPHRQSQKSPPGSHCSAPASESWLTSSIPSWRLFRTGWERKKLFRHRKRTQNVAISRDFLGDFMFRAQKNAKNNVTNLITTVNYNESNTTQRFYDIFNQQSMSNWSHFYRVEITMKFFPCPRKFWERNFMFTGRLEIFTPLERGKIFRGIAQWFFPECDGIRSREGKFWATRERISVMKRIFDADDSRNFLYLRKLIIFF